MIIQPMTVAYATGEIARSAVSKGGTRGPATIFTGAKDTVSLGSGFTAGADLYSGNHLFKMMGTVELMSIDCATVDEMSDFGDAPVSM